MRYKKICERCKGSGLIAINSTKKTAIRCNVCFGKGYITSDYDPFTTRKLAEVKVVKIPAIYPEHSTTYIPMLEIDYSDFCNNVLNRDTLRLRQEDRKFVCPALFESFCNPDTRKKGTEDMPCYNIDFLNYLCCPFSLNEKTILDCWEKYDKL